VVVVIQLSHRYSSGGGGGNETTTSTRTTLPDVDTDALLGYNISIYYMPPSPYESFYDTIMNKFCILQLTQYQRIIVLDGDVMPMSNLDYLFALSKDYVYGLGNSTLKENVIVAGPMEPSNAGFFMLSPQVGDYEQIRQVIAARVEQAQNTNVTFDVVQGWGHEIVSPDQWMSRKGRGTNWTFIGAFADQGLLYHWTKYVKKSVSIVFFERVENWSTDTNGKPYLEQELHDVFTNYSKPLIQVYFACTKFMCDFIHFTGRGKPWLSQPPDDVSESTQLRDGKHLWWYSLHQVNAELNLGLDLQNWVSLGQPTLGMYPKWSETEQYVKKIQAQQQLRQVTSKLEPK
jgi:hypothetical protein